MDRRTLSKCGRPNVGGTGNAWEFHHVVFCKDCAAAGVGGKGILPNSITLRTLECCKKLRPACTIFVSEETITAKTGRMLR
mmetsp:Transcript_24226/g.50356  ORF Transcript_24226/g.50356 Transcript_24226/m.50356 type:complete len:81 (+) Transcript_24226:232-474(+)